MLHKSLLPPLVLSGVDLTSPALLSYTLPHNLFSDTWMQGSERRYRIHIIFTNQKLGNTGSVWDLWTLWIICSVYLWCETKINSDMKMTENSFMEHMARSTWLTSLMSKYLKFWTLMSGEVTFNLPYQFYITWWLKERREDPHFYINQNENKIKLITNLIIKVISGSKRFSSLCANIYVFSLFQLDN